MSLLGIRIILNSRCIRFHLKAPESSFQFPWHSVHCLHFTLYSRPGSLRSWVCGPKVTTVLGVWADGHYGPGCVGWWSLWSWVCGLMVTTVLGVWADGQLVLGVWTGGHYGPGRVGRWSLRSWACGLCVWSIHVRSERGSSQSHYFLRAAWLSSPLANSFQLILSFQGGRGVSFSHGSSQSSLSPITALTGGRTQSPSLLHPAWHTAWSPTHWSSSTSAWLPSSPAQVSVPALACARSLGPSQGKDGGKGREIMENALESDFALFTIKF